MIFPFKNTIDQYTKTTTIVNINCNLCNKETNTSYKNYLKCIKHERLIENYKISGLYLCRKCSKKTQDTNDEIISKIKNGVQKFHDNPLNKGKTTAWINNIKKKKTADYKRVKTIKEKYGNDYFKKLLRNTGEREERRKTSFNKQQNEKIKKFTIELPDKLMEIKNNLLNDSNFELDKNNKIHAAFIRQICGLKEYQFIHDELVNYSTIKVKNNNYDVDVIKNTSVCRKSQGTIKRGWIDIKNNVIKYDSLTELSFILWKQDNFISKELTRSSESFTYEFENKNHKYYPDFFDKENNIFIEVKCKCDYNINYEKINKKLKAVLNSVLIFDTQIPKEYKSLAQILIKEYESKKI